MFDNIIAGTSMLKYLDYRLILLLLAIGFLTKHCFNKLPNSSIPYLLLLVALVYEVGALSIFAYKNIGNSVIDAIINASIAIGLHTSGKGLFKFAVDPTSVRDMLAGIFRNKSPTTNTVSNTTESDLTVTKPTDTVVDETEK